MNETKKFKNFAFISYSHKDMKQAERLDNFLLDFRLPVSVKQKYPDRRESFKDIFRDNTGMGAATDLSSEIRRQLDQSEYLIVVCSPNAVESDWVNEEIEYFKSIRGLDYIYPFVVDGIVNAKSPNESHECMPEALRPYKGRAANISTYSFEHAIIEILADILKIEVDEIWQRHVRLEEERKQKLEEQNNRLLIAQSRFISEKAHQLTEENNPFLAAILVSNVLPNNLEEPDLPYVTEAERALREAQNHQEMILMHHSVLWYAKLSPDEQLIASACDDCTIWLWDRKTGGLLNILKGHTGSIQQVAFTPDGKKVASASHDGTTRLWNIQTGECLSVYEGHEGIVFSVAFSPDGKLMATGSEDTTIKLWDTNTGSCITTLFGHNHNVLSIAFTSDGKTIISSSADGTIRIWEKNISIIKGNEWGCKKTLQGHHSGVWSALLSPDEKHIVSASGDDTIRIWNTKTGECQKILNENGQYNPNTGLSVNTRKGVSHASFSKDGKSIVSAFKDRTIRIWDWENGTYHIITEKYKDFATSVFYTSDGNEIITADQEGKVHIHRNIRKTLRYKPSTYEISYAFFHKNNQTIISNNWQTLRIWDITTGRCTHEFEKKCFLEQSDGNAYIWSRDILQCYRIFGNKICDNSPYFFPEKKCLIPICKIGESHLAEEDYEKYIAEESVLYLYDITSKEIIQSFHGHTSWITDATFCPDGKTILTSSADRTIRMWDIWTGNCLHILEGHNDEVFHISLSSDGAIMASLDYSNICVWDMKTMKCIRTLTDEEQHFKYASLSFDGKWLVITKEKSILVLSITTGDYVLDINYPSEKIISVVFSPNGRKLAASFEKGIIRILDFPPFQELMDETRERFKNRQLTPEERKKYYLD